MTLKHPLKLYLLHEISIQRLRPLQIRNSLMNVCIESDATSPPIGSIFLRFRIMNLFFNFFKNSGSHPGRFPKSATLLPPTEVTGKILTLRQNISH